MACLHAPVSCWVLTSALLVPPAGLGISHVGSALSPGPPPCLACASSPTALLCLAQVHTGSVLGPGMRHLASAAPIQSQNQGLPTIEKCLLGSKTHHSCLSYFLWLENREGVVGSRLGGEAASRRQRGRRALGWSRALRRRPAVLARKRSKGPLNVRTLGRGTGSRHQEVGSLRPASGLARAPRYSHTQQVRKAKRSRWLVFLCDTEVFCRLGWGLRRSG